MVGLQAQLDSETWKFLSFFLLFSSLMAMYVKRKTGKSRYFLLSPLPAYVRVYLHV